MRTLILALNPAVDLEWQVDQVHWDEKNLIRSERRWAGGKGVNVARWLGCLGGRPRLLLPLGGAPGAELRRECHREKLPCSVVPVAEANRVDIIVTTPAGRQLRFNPAGPRLNAAEWRAIFSRVEVELDRCDTMILSGSLPRNASPRTYARLIQRARGKRVRVLLDCDGPVFVEGAKAKPFLVKPNEHELAQWCGRPLKTDAAIRTAACQLSRLTSGWVFVSRGSGTAWLVHAPSGQAYGARPPRLSIANSVGAGDALLAGAAWQIQLGTAPVEWLRWGVAAGTAATQCRAGELPSRRLVRDLVVRVIMDGKSKAIPL